MTGPDHDRIVNEWLERVKPDDSPAAFLRVFESGWNALWRRAESAVGLVTLELLGERVRSNSVEKHPILSPLKLGAAGLSCRALEDAAGALDKQELRAALGFMLVELLAMIGDLTDQLLTPGLYEELSRTGPGEDIRPDAVAQATPEAEPIMKDNRDFIPTGVSNLDAILTGGLVAGSSVAVVGSPGSGKTILAQQIAFNFATPEKPVLFFSTLSEPGAKTLFYLNKFSYSDPKKIGKSVHFVDLGVLLRAKGLQETLKIITGHLNEIEPALVVVDSFRVFEEMASSTEELRKFSYKLVIDLMTRKCTALFLGEYAAKDYESNPLYSIIDGVITMGQRELSGEQQRFIKVVKMRGLAHNREENPFRITKDGINIFAPRLTIKRTSPEKKTKEVPRCRIGIEKLDDLLGGGIPRGSSLLLAGVAGTGKTVLGLEFIYRGAQAGEKGILFSFEETGDRLRAEATGLGLDLDDMVKKGLVEIVFIPQPDIMVEEHLLMMHEKIAEMKADRVVVDSLSVFLHKVVDPQLAREKVFQLASIVQNAGAVGLFATDIPYGTTKISRFGVEETVVDGVIILSSEEENRERERYIEVYKLRNTAHLRGRHSMMIGPGGIQIYPRYRPQEINAPPSPKNSTRLSTGIAGLDKLLGSGVLSRSLTLITGSAGIGKSIIALQYLLEGAARREQGLFVTLEESPEEIISNAAALGLPLKKALDDGLLSFLYLPPTHIPRTQLLAILTDTIKERKVRRVSLDSITHIVATGKSLDNIRDLLYDIVVRFKNLGVTTVFTQESGTMFTMDFDMERGFSALADNMIMLRYAAVGNAVKSSVMVVKTRGSAHDQGLYSMTIGKGGVEIGPALPVDGKPQPEAAGARRRH